MVVVVVNVLLMDNHQAELAHTLQAKHYLLVASPEYVRSSQLISH